ncbi:putative gustatory receptor 28b [Belonocnema kinseyi]|uniref:putative gustatory receptor 28b n=1 Tax=Belonocnema kinseyi TaxID=2817044 RepID=UPI00143D92E8|nr:putative gustatory receptor 28b [Belonocnema kinseyi]
MKSRRTRDILFAMKNTIQNAELKEEVEQFSLQLTQRPLEFSLCGFMTLDYSLVQGFLQQVTTYLILLIHYKIGVQK